MGEQPRPRARRPGSRLHSRHLNVHEHGRFVFPSVSAWTALPPAQPRRNILSWSKGFTLSRAGRDPGMGPAPPRGPRGAQSRSRHDLRERKESEGNGEAGRVQWGAQERPTFDLEPRSRSRVPGAARPATPSRKPPLRPRATALRLEELFSAKTFSALLISKVGCESQVRGRGGVSAPL